MPYTKNTAYQNMLFSSETPKDEFYTFSSIPALVEKSETFKEEIFSCRTVGILHSTQGRFYLTDVNTPILQEDEPIIRVTMKYLKSPPKSPVAPYPVQIFGTLQWWNRPVLFAKILQTLTSSMAIRLRDTLEAVVSTHLATSGHQDTDLDISMSDLNDTFVADSM